MDNPIRQLSEAESIVCKACYEAGQASALPEIRELESKLEIAIRALEWIYEMPDSIDASNYAREALNKIKV